LPRHILIVRLLCAGFIGSLIFFALPPVLLATLVTLLLIGLNVLDSLQPVPMLAVAESEG
jgi:hypothetical protein